MAMTDDDDESNLLVSLMDSCDAPEITHVFVTKSNPYNWEVTSHHERPFRPPGMSDTTYNVIFYNTPSDNKFEINIYKKSETEYTICFHSFSHSITPFWDLYRQTKEYLENFPIGNRLPYLRLYTAYHSEENDDQEADADADKPQSFNDIEKYVFNKYIGMEICSYIF
jgi:hypothetical protein